MKRRKSRRFDTVALTPRSHVRRDEAVRFVAEQVAERGEHPRVVRNRVSKRIGYDLEKGRLPAVTPGVIQFGRLIAWARDTYPGKFLEWPALRSVSADFQAGYGILEAKAEAQPPSDLAECQALVCELRRKITALQKEAAELRSYKDAAERKRQQGRAAAARARQSH